MSTRGRSTRKLLITDVFPAVPGHTALPAQLDAVYYSYRDKMMYFLKGEDLWRNKSFNRRDHTTHNSIEHIGKWYDKWLDICDVAVMD